jgi:hypothetical protein
MGPNPDSINHGVIKGSLKLDIETNSIMDCNVKSLARRDSL